MRFKKSFHLHGALGQGRGIAMGVTRLLLLGPFYTIQTPKTPNISGGVYTSSNCCPLCILKNARKFLNFSELKCIFTNL